MTAIAVLAAVGTCAAAQQTMRDVQYYALDERYPRGLGDFQVFGLLRTVSRGKVHYEGWVMLDRNDPNGSTVDMRSVRVTGKTLVFDTKPRRGMTFSFRGTFLESGDLTRYANKRVPVVQGVVTKYRRGKRVAAGRMRFTVGAGG